MSGQALSPCILHSMLHQSAKNVLGTGEQDMYGYPTSPVSHCAEVGLAHHHMVDAWPYGCMFELLQLKFTAAVDQNSKITK